MIVELPDKTTIEFPDDMPQEQMSKIIREQVYNQVMTAPTPTATPAGQVENVMGLFPQPQMTPFAKGMIEQLPAAGMTVGGFAGAPAGPLGAVAGAGLGGGVGAAAKGYLQESLGLRPPKLPMENWADIGKESAMGAAAEMGGPIIAKGVQKVVSPFAGTIEARMAADPTIAAAQKLVEQQGAPISPEVIAGTKTARFFDWMAEKLWPASAVMANRRQSLQPLADSLKTEFVASRGLYDTSKGGVNQAWENWVNMAGGSAAPYEMPKTAEALTQAAGKPFAQMGTFWKKHAATFADTVEKNGAATVQDIRDLLNVLNPTAAKGAERTARMKIADAIMDDLGASGNKEMVDALANARDMARLQRIAGPLQVLFNKATIEPVKAGEEAVFNPSSFVNLWNQRRGNFLNNKNYSAEDIRVIDAFADKMKAMVPDLAMAAKAETTPTLSIQGAMTNPLTVGAGIYTKPGLAVPVGLDAMLANSLMSPTGTMRKFLTSGFGPPTLSSKIGLMEGLEAAND